MMKWVKENGIALVTAGMAATAAMATLRTSVANHGGRLVALEDKCKGTGDLALTLKTDLKAVIGRIDRGDVRIEEGMREIRVDVKQLLREVGLLTAHALNTTGGNGHKVAAIE